MMIYDYFTFCIYNEDGSIKEKSQYIFKNDRNHKINEYTRLIELIYYFVIQVLDKTKFDYISGFSNQDEAQEYIDEELEDEVITKYFKLKKIIDNSYHEESHDKRLMKVKKR